MNSLIKDPEQILFTPPDKLVEERIPDRNVFQPEERRCPFCGADLKTYKTIPSRRIITLEGSRIIAVKQLFCPNRECIGRKKDKKTGTSKLPVFKSKELRHVVLKRMQYGLDVVIEIGQRAYEDPKPGRQLQREINREYRLDISLASIYRFKDLYESLLIGIIEEHSHEITEKLHNQPAFILTIDAITYKGAHSLYRAVDFISGFCLGTMLVPEGGKALLKQWRSRLYKKFGLPDFIVTDGEPALHLDVRDKPKVGHQDCWYHVLQNIFRTLVENWEKKTKSFLQKIHYRRIFNRLFQELEQIAPNVWLPHGEPFRDIIRFFLGPVTGVPVFTVPMAIRLQQFEDAKIILNEWEAILRGRKTRRNRDNPLFVRYRALKNQLSKQELTNYFQHEIFQTDPIFHVFQQLKAIIDNITGTSQFKTLVKEYKDINNEILRLRSIVLGAIIDRNENSQWFTKTPQTRSEEYLQRLLCKNTARAKKELAKIPKFYHFWHWPGTLAKSTLQEKGEHVLQRIIDNWRRNKSDRVVFRKAANILDRHRPFLLTFLTHAAIPPSNQALETDNGQLKQLWRLSSGCQDKPYTLVYHGNSSSMARNFHTISDYPSSFEILGFSQEVLQQWLYSCSSEHFTTARLSMKSVRSNRLLRLRAARHTLIKIFRDHDNDILQWGISRLEEYLFQK